MMRQAILVLCLSIFSAGLSAASDRGRSIDMRKCPLDTITFVDPWAGSTFEVTKVGADYTYDCPSGMKPSPPATEERKGPFGDLILEGTYTEDAGKQTMFAIYKSIEGSPCCGWSSLNGKEDSILSGRKNFKWFSQKDMPRLGEFQFASIDPDQATPDADAKQLINNPLIAMKCRLP